MSIQSTRIARGTLQILCIAVIAATVSAARYLIFEYGHGDHHVVERLVDIAQGGKS